MIFENINLKIIILTKIALIMLTVLKVSLSFEALEKMILNSGLLFIVFLCSFLPLSLPYKLKEELTGREARCHLWKQGGKSSLSKLTAQCMS